MTRLRSDRNRFARHSTEGRKKLAEAGVMRRPA
jgi:hypothetical protein